MTTFSVGSLVKARGREWVVLPGSDLAANLMVLRPLGGSDDEIAGIDPRLEEVVSAEFSLPDPGQLGNHHSCRLLRDAVRLGFRSGAGPFRCLAGIAVEPRPYQFVPLLLALRSDPVRLLIADDVGIGKTVEACLIARELIDRGEVRSMAVLCPPHLAEQWQRALRTQFHIETALLLSGTASKLQRECDFGESVFSRFPFTVVSTDFIKLDSRRHEFLRAAPDLVIVDEAHGCASGMGRSGQQQRHQLLRELTRKASLHLVLVTATPHSGNQEAFRSLLALLNPDLQNLPQDLSGEENRRHREQLANFLVQRKRADLEGFMGSETLFPKRDPVEESYVLGPEYHALFGRVLDYCQERVSLAGLGKHQQRVQWWAALGLLRALGSSPVAAAAALRTRAASAGTETEEEADEAGRRTVLDQDDESAEALDVAPGSQTDAADDGKGSPEKDRLLRLAREIAALEGERDAKLQRAVALVRQLLKDGFSPILFCRFIPTVHYVAEHLRKALPKDVALEALTGELPPEEREERIEKLPSAGKRVLVCTDCLSEGINLQDSFDAVMHYDLSWNPTRHEQREGRVDRYGQSSKIVRALTFYGKDNPVDGMVLEVLLRKSRAIQGQLGILVPVPHDSQSVVAAVMEGIMVRGRQVQEQMTFGFAEPTKKQLHFEWEQAAEREKKSRSLFAQRGIHVDEIAAEISAARKALGDDRSVEAFCRTTFAALGIAVDGTKPATVNLAPAPAALRDAVDEDGTVILSFSAPATRGSTLVTRTHPLVSGLATYVLETALDGAASSPARRCGAIRTAKVRKKTTLILARMRFHLVTRRGDEERQLLAEDVALFGFEGSTEAPRWLSDEEAEAVLLAEPDANVSPDIARSQLEATLASFADLRSAVEERVRTRGETLFEAHRRVRKAASLGVRALRVEPHLPVDVLGLYLFLPAKGGAA